MLQSLLLYIPISLFGLWRWTYWLVRIIGASLYKPKYTTWPKGRAKLTVSIVTPVYNEDEPLFKQAMQSWIDNGVDEIIAVIDKTNVRLIAEFARRYEKNTKVRCRMVVTPKKGKRAALCDGINRATGSLIALVDSDTVWSEGVVEKTLPYFLDPQIGGATLAQRIMDPRSTSDVLFDILLWTRYREEVPFLLGIGKAFNTLSGRTAIYRRDALLNDAYDNVHLLRHEFFMGTRGISGDDKRLTHLILEQGWHVAYVKGPAVYTQGIGSMGQFMKQRLRWTRNSWRADLRAVAKGWVFKHPALAFFMIDRFIQPFFILLGPTACVIAITLHEWLAVSILVGWWILSRFVRLFGYFYQNPKRLVFLPAYILYTYVNALAKIYALATVLEHNWATRWHKNRLARKNILQKLATSSAGAVAIVLLVYSAYLFVNRINVESATNIPVPVALTADELQTALAKTTTIAPGPVLPTNAVLPAGVQLYTVQPGDTLAKLSQKLGMSVPDLKRLGNISDPDRITVGQNIFYYTR